MLKFLLVASASAFAPAAPAPRAPTSLAASRRELFSSLAGVGVAAVATPALAIPGVFPPGAPSASDPSMQPTMKFGQVCAPYGPRDGCDIWTQNGFKKGYGNGAGNDPAGNGYDKSRGIYGWVKPGFKW